jgi:hypothetical protein
LRPDVRDLHDPGEHNGSYDYVCNHSETRNEMRCVAPNTSPNGTHA